jgi:hypothetical protein
MLKGGFSHEHPMLWVVPIVAEVKLKKILTPLICQMKRSL